MEQISFEVRAWRLAIAPAGCWIIRGIEAWREAEDGSRLGVQTAGWNSPKSLYCLPADWARWLTRALNGLVQRWDPPMQVAECWANIEPPGAEIAWHTHSQFPVAGLLFLTAHSTPTLFTLADKELVVLPSPGLFLIFPGSLQHRVPRVEGQTRYTVAANFQSC